MRIIFTLILFLLVKPVVANSIAIGHIGLMKGDSASYETLKEKGFTPRKDLRPWPYSLPLDWDADPFSDRNWRFQFHAWRIIDPILLKYRKTQNVSYLNEAITIIRDWYNFHVLETKTTDMSWYDMSVGLRAMKLAWIWNETSKGRKKISDDTRKELHHLMELHARELMEESRLASNNHAYYQLVGLRLICISNTEINECKDEIGYNNKKMQELLLSQFTEEGFHREHSPSYHFFAIRTLKDLNISSLYSESIDDLIDKAKKVSPWLVYPDRTVARFGDSSGTSGSHLPLDIEIHTIGNSKTLIGDFTDSGYFTVRSTLDTAVKNSTQLFITGMSDPGEAHKHADELSFELFHKGKLVIIDSGKYAYKKDRYRDYVRSARAHNTLSVEDINIGPKDVSGFSTKFTNVNTNDAEIVVKGYVERPELFNHHRTFYITPFTDITVVDTFQDQISLLTKIKHFSFRTIFTSNLHINPDLELIRLTKNRVRIKDHADIKLKSDVCELKLTRGQNTPILGWVSFAYNETIEATVVQAMCSIPFLSSHGKATWEISLL